MLNAMICIQRMRYLTINQASAKAPPFAAHHAIGAMPLGKRFE
jgi:hypothetical protein